LGQGPPPGGPAGDHLGLSAGEIGAELVAEQLARARERAAWEQLEGCRRLARFGTPLDWQLGAAPRVRDAKLEAWALAQLPRLTEAWRAAWVRANPGGVPPDPSE